MLVSEPRLGFVQLTVRRDHDGLHTVAVAVTHHHLVRPPGPGIHQDLQQPLDHKEKVNSAKDRERDVEVVVVGEQLATLPTFSLLSGIGQSRIS